MGAGRSMECRRERRIRESHVAGVTPRGRGAICDGVGTASCARPGLVVDPALDTKTFPRANGAVVPTQSGSAKTKSPLPALGRRFSGVSSTGIEVQLPPPMPVPIATYCLPSTE